jgi:UDP-3-O-[3-hydroxymyristoyl] glucosamine N-acyltransferase
MQFKQAQTLQSIANLLNCKYVGDASFPIAGINEIHRVEAGDIVFVDHPKYYDKALNSAATIVLINKEVECPEGKALIISENPFLDFNKITKHFKPVSLFPETGKNSIHPTAQIAKGVHIGENVSIGANTIINPNCVIYDETIIGENVIIHANCTLGSDAFYFQKREGRFVKMHSCGKVVIEDDVELGANCTIDRGVSAITKIGKGSKLDNQIHIGHDTTLGENCLMAAQSAIAGCVTIGNNVTMWGQIAIASDVVIGDGAEILAKSGVNKNLEGDKRYFGTPAIEARQKMKEIAQLGRLIKNS